MTSLDTLTRCLLCLLYRLPLRFQYSLLRRQLVFVGELPLLDERRVSVTFRMAALE